MCVVGFNVVDLELAVGVAGEDITMTMIADHVIPREYGNVAVDKFQAKFSSGNWSLNLSYRYNNTARNLFMKQTGQLHINNVFAVELMMVLYLFLFYSTTFNALQILKTALKCHI